MTKTVSLHANNSVHYMQTTVVIAYLGGLLGVWRVAMGGEEGRWDVLEGLRRGAIP